MDDVDFVNEVLEREEARRKQRQQMVPRLRGPDECNACGALNDRAEEGYAVCTYCKCARR